jgi:aspartate/methionine/tyrosine aminotransferase
VCNPNNPTGHILTPTEMDSIVRIAEKSGAWIVADEAYRGAERLQDDFCISFWGKYDRVIATSSLSKAWGLPGLRLGWAVCPKEIYDTVWMCHEYLAISTSVPSMLLAELALDPDTRLRINQRARRLIRSGFCSIEGWLGKYPGKFEMVPPQAAAIAFIRYNLDIPSSKLAHQLIQEKSVFIAPGSSFGLEHFFRIGFGLPAEILLPALEHIDEFLSML